MKIDLLVADIGSTTTVINAFDRLNSKRPVFLGQGMSLTTVTDTLTGEENNVVTGLYRALDDLEARLGEKIKWETLLASSSAAGGLKMSVHGLVYDMTARAAKEAALGAGAVVTMVTAGELGTADLRQLKSDPPSIILLAGGVDYGEKETILKNAVHLGRLLEEMKISIPVIYCGNRGALKEAEQIFKDNDLSLVVTENVYPAIDRLNVEPARKEIHKVFNNHIVEARGMEKIRTLVQKEIIPTPGAVMEGALLAYDHLEDLVVFDVGGATTDVHSVTEGTEEIQNMLLHPEPKAKRTVEGDLGVYRNYRRLVEIYEQETLSQKESTFTPGYKPSPVPGNREESRKVEILAGLALKTALLRHVGSWRYIYGPTGRQTVVEGKDLTGVKTVIGTGGALARLSGGKQLMVSALRGKTGLELLPRGELVYLIDSCYIMAAVGVIKQYYPDDAWALLAGSLGLYN